MNIFLDVWYSLVAAYSGHEARSMRAQLMLVEHQLIDAKWEVAMLDKHKKQLEGAIRAFERDVVKATMKQKGIDV